MDTVPGKMHRLQPPSSRVPGGIAVARSENIGAFIDPVPVWSEDIPVF
jgi:hypothetical protein